MAKDLAIKHYKLQFRGYHQAKYNVDNLMGQNNTQDATNNFCIKIPERIPTNLSSTRSMNIKKVSVHMKIVINMIALFGLPYLTQK